MGFENFITYYTLGFELTLSCLSRLAPNSKRYSTTLYTQYAPLYRVTKEFEVIQCDTLLWEDILLPQSGAKNKASRPV